VSSGSTSCGRRPVISRVEWWVVFMSQKGVDRPDFFELMFPMGEQLSQCGLGNIVFWRGVEAIDAAAR
jgi:hypothetical protein